MNTARMVAARSPTVLMIVTFVTCVQQVSAANVPVTLDLGPCGEVLASTPFNDYRNAPKWNLDDNWRAHTYPAITRIRAGEFSERVIADLNFTLQGFPNHIAALRALVDYELGGGKSYSYLPVECYFVRARNMVPDDAAVVALEAIYFWKKGKLSKAVESFEQALDMAPESTDLHYNLGLLFYQMGRYESALEHARIAYASGYPLPGLRQKLEAAGIWQQGRQAGELDSAPN